jgi:ubiquitin-protein ligase
VEKRDPLVIAIADVYRKDIKEFETIARFWTRQYAT